MKDFLWGVAGMILFAAAVPWAILALFAVIGIYIEYFYWVVPRIFAW